MRTGAGVSVVAATLLALPAAAGAPEAFAKPRGTYVRVDPPNVLWVGSEPLAAGAPHVLFLNRCVGGLSLSPGAVDDSAANVSQILDGPVTMPAFPHGDDAWAEVVSITTSLFSPFNIAVTDVDPGAAPHDEAVVCGTSADAGMAGDFWGVAPYSCGVIPSAVTFTFAASIGNSPRDIAETIAQEAAHAWGLDHSYKCEDPMTYLFDCGAKSFQDGDFACGEYEARACTCGGATQNTVQHILQAFGAPAPDTQAPAVSILHPVDGDAFPFGEVFDVELEVADDHAVASVSLFLDGALQATDDVAPFGGWPVIDLPVGIYTMHAEASDLAGNVAESRTVRLEVVGEAGPAAGDDDNGGTDDGTGDGAADDSGADSGGVDGPGPSLPAGWGQQTEGQSAACAVGGDRRGGARWLWMLFIAGAVRRRHRR